MNNKIHEVPGQTMTVLYFESRSEGCSTEYTVRIRIPRLGGFLRGVIFKLRSKAD